MIKEITPAELLTDKANVSAASPIRWPFFALATVLLCSLLLANPAVAASACKGKSKSACGAASSCSWVDSYKTKKGSTVKAFCRSKPGKGKKKAAQSSTSKPSTSKSKKAAASSSSSKKSVKSTKTAKSKKKSDKKSVKKKSSKKKDGKKAKKKKNSKKKSSSN